MAGSAAGRFAVEYGRFDGNKITVTIINGPRACAVFQLASLAVSQNDVRFKYRFYLQFPISEFHNVFSFNNDFSLNNNIIFQNSFAF